MRFRTLLLLGAPFLVGGSGGCCDAMENFLSSTKVPPTALSATDETLYAEFKHSEARAKEVNDRINAIDRMSQAPFEAWRLELGQYTNPLLRIQS